MLTLNNRNVAESQFNFVTETVNCKQLVSRIIINVMITYETIYKFINKLIIELIKIL